jgi:hypothetical protein
LTGLGEVSGWSGFDTMRAESFPHLEFQ